MKNYLFLLILMLVFGGLLFSSCVSTKKFEASQAKCDKLQNDNDKANNQLIDCNKQVVKLSNDKIQLQGENTVAVDDLNEFAMSAKSTISAQSKRLNDLEKLFQSQKIVMEKLKSSISDALLNYESDELTVYLKDGNVYISLEEKLLFKTGSDEIDPKGKDALKVLSKVLNSTENIEVCVEGHTDNVPINNEMYSDNWDLSTARATSIVRIITSEYGFDAARITASGKGQFHPVKNNDTVKARAANRRTEIILSPDLKELYALFY